MCAIQFQALREYKRRQNDEIQSEMKKEIKRRIEEKVGNEGSKEKSSNIKTTPLLRLRIVDLFESEKSEDEFQEKKEARSGLLTLWRPEKELVEHLSENFRFRIFGLIANSIRDGEVQFRTTKQTKFVRDENKIENKFESISDFKRRFTDIGDIIFSNNFSPKFQEVDVVGIAVTVSEKSSNSETAKSPKTSFETVYICDTMFNFAAVHFWGGLSECGFEKSMFLSENSSKRSTPKAEEVKAKVLIFKNLQWRSSSARGGFYRQTNK